MDHFRELLQRYLDKTATGQEREELFSLIATGAFDDEIGQDYIERLKAELSRQDNSGKSQNEEALERIYDKLIDTQQQTQVIPIRRGATWRWMAAACLALLMTLTIGVLRNYFFVHDSKQEIAKKYNGRQYVHLPDGSTVLLNEGSELSYTVSFGSETREVSLSGEGYFDIRHNPAKPFLVHAGKVTTRVLGTAFDVNTNRDQVVVVTVTRGLVEVSDETKIYGRFKPDQQLTINTATNNYSTEEVNAENTLAWKSNYLILDAVTLGEAMEKIGVRFDKKIHATNPKMQKCIISVSFLKGESLQQMIGILTSLTNSTYTIKDNLVTIEGGSCN